jgi:hypothetical protein
MNELTAIDILINPDEVAIKRAREMNARILESVPSPPGFALDEHHQPHITVLQRYVNTADLDRVYDAVGALFASIELSKLTFTAAAIGHMTVAAYPGVGLTAMVVKPGPEVLDFQSKLIEALMPNTGSGGTARKLLKSWPVANS